ncbi:MAG: hypothetical protein AAGF13_05770 [Pseudomonadota bacterium]
MRRSIRKLAAGSALSRWILGFLIVTTILILTAPTRTIQLQARTLSAEVELVGEPLAWDLTAATVCLPTLDFDADPAPPCGFGEAFETELDGPVTWQRGQKISVNWRPDHLLLSLMTDGNGWPAGTVLRIDPEDAVRNGALAFSGYLSLGQEMSAGATGYVLEGSYAIYEQGLLSGWLGWSPEITRQGAIRRGDQVRIVCARSLLGTCDGALIEEREGQFLNPVAASLSVDHDGKAGLRVVATGAESNSLLEVAYAGRDSIILVRPSWVQRAAASSSLLAFSLLFSLMAPILIPMLDRSTKQS